MKLIRVFTKIIDIEHTRLFSSFVDGSRVPLKLHVQARHLIVVETCSATDRLDTGYFPLKTRVDRVSLILSIMMLPQKRGRMSKCVAAVTKVVRSFEINSIEQLVPHSVFSKLT